ncbi:MAG: DUF29 domain-containing protein [Chloroflexi bacterium]|nr:DUF29 domain-containing protein [Chloroflexota bacterium]
MSTYERDFYAWTQNQATLLRTHEFARLDIDNLIEEIESMGRSERRQLTSRLEVLLIHLLKWQFQPELRGRSWELTIIEQRRRIDKLLHNNPSLRSETPELLIEAYDDAAFGAMRETGLPLATFPHTCPFALKQVLDQGWLPE